MQKKNCSREWLFIKSTLSQTDKGLPKKEHSKDDYILKFY